MTLWREVWLVAGKDLRIEARTRVTAQQIVPFGLIVLLLFAFALDPDRGILQRVAPGLFWVTVLLAALLAVSRSFSIEADNGARDGLRLSGLDGPALFLGKAAAIALQLLALEVVLAATVVLVYGIELNTLVPLVLATLAATVGVAATGTLYGVLAAGVRVRETLVPVLLLPVVAPVLLGATRAWEAAIDGIPSDAWPWVALLGGVRAALHGDRDAGLRPAPGGSMNDGTRLLKPQLSKLLGWLALVSVIVLALFGLWGAPKDEVQGDAQRLMYLHVPAAWIAYLAFGITSLGSALWLWPRTRATVWDRIAGASAELGVIFTALTLILGSLWGRPVWGVWWAWDARLVTTAVLFFLYLGYLALRRIPAAPEARAKRCAIAALIAFVDVPIVHFSVNWWRTLHQQGTVFNERLDAKIHGVMAFTLWFGVLAFTLLFVYLLDKRYHLLALDEDREEREVEQAIAERVGAVTP